MIREMTVGHVLRRKSPRNQNTREPHTASQYEVSSASETNFLPLLSSCESPLQSNRPDCKGSDSEQSNDCDSPVPVMIGSRCQTSHHKSKNQGLFIGHNRHPNGLVLFPQILFQNGLTNHKPLQGPRMIVVDRQLHQTSGSVWAAWA